jgi:hypothetical protein
MNISSRWHGAVSLVIRLFRDSWDKYRNSRPIAAPRAVFPNVAYVDLDWAKVAVASTGFIRRPKMSLDDSLPLGDLRQSFCEKKEARHECEALITCVGEKP